VAYRKEGGGVILNLKVEGEGWSMNWKVGGGGNTVIALIFEKRGGVHDHPSPAPMVTPLMQAGAYETDVPKMLKYKQIDADIHI